MFFLYVLKVLGYPISQVFERDIKNIATSRFSVDFDDEYKVLYRALQREKRDKLKEEWLDKYYDFGIDRDSIFFGKGIWSNRESRYVK
jgi:hypothetical protein